MKSLMRKFLFTTGLIGLLATQAQAGGFQLFENTAAGLGVAHADATAGADDAATEYNNPAGMVRIKQKEISAGTELVALHIKFTGSTFTAYDNEAGDVLTLDKQSGVAKANDVAVVPNLHFVTPLSDKLYYGMGITAPFGLAVSFKDDSIASQYATNSAMKTINLSQDLAYALNNKFSLGAGLDVQQYQAEFDANLVNEVTIKNNLSDVALGWHVGALYQFSPKTRIGVAFHSPVFHNGVGQGTTSSDGTLLPLAYHPTSTISGKMPLPGWFSAGYFHQINSKVAVMANYTYTMWSIIKDLNINNIPVMNLGDVTVDTTIHLPEDFRNTSTFTTGMTYQLTPKWQLKYGMGYDQSPTTNKNRELRLPDSDKFLLSTGVRYQASKNLTIDAGYEHAFAAEATIGKVSPLLKIGAASQVDVHMQGDLQASADILGMQATYRF